MHPAGSAAHEICYDTRHILPLVCLLHLLVIFVTVLTQLIEKQHILDLAAKYQCTFFLKCCWLI